jgi:hypothetical protein
MSMHAQRAGTTTGLASHFYETREDQSRRALVDAVTRQPDTTMAELAAFVEQHPELRGMTLDELLQRVRRDLARQAPSRQTLADRLERVDQTSQGWTRIPAGPSWPEAHVSGEAARRIRGYEHAIADVVIRVTHEVERSNERVEQVTIYPESISPGDVAINFRVDTTVAEKRGTLWQVLAEIEPDLPFELWLALG